MKHLAYLIIFFLPLYTATSDLTLYKNPKEKPFSHTTSKSKKKSNNPIKKNVKNKQNFSEFVTTTITRDVIKKSTEAILVGCIAECCIQSITQQSKDYPFFPYAFAIPHALFLARASARLMQLFKTMYSK